MDEIAYLDEQIKMLRERRNKLWRARTITLGELLDLSDSLAQSGSDIKRYTGDRLERILKKL